MTAIGAIEKVGSVATQAIQKNAGAIVEKGIQTIEGGSDKLPESLDCLAASAKAQVTGSVGTVKPYYQDLYIDSIVEGATPKEADSAARALMFTTGKKADPEKMEYIKNIAGTWHDKGGRHPQQVKDDVPIYAQFHAGITPKPSKYEQILDEYELEAEKLGITDPVKKFRYAWAKADSENVPSKTITKEVFSK